MSKRIFHILLAFLFLLPFSINAARLTRYVNPFIGTGGHGHVFLGANVPFGMVQLGPTQPTRGWDWCSGYHYSDSVLLGFSHMHLSGTGIGDLGDVTMLPVLQPQQHEVLFRHADEQVRPGYYAVTLQNGIKVELTATERVGLHSYTTPSPSDSLFVRLDLKLGIGWDGLEACRATLENPTTISGHRFSRGWANRQKVFFVAEFSRPISNTSLLADTLSVLSFAPSDQPLLVRVGLSAVSVDGARANLRAELNHWNFRRVALQADRKWETQLGKIIVPTHSDPTALHILYTALYHTMIAPSLFSDVNGDYRGADGQVHHADHATYTTWSLWDTYRAAHPLMTLIHPERQSDLAATLIDIWHQQGKLPVWHLMGCETDCMVGCPGIPVLADMVLKGLTDRNAEALQAMKASALMDERGLGLLKQYGYIPCDLFEEQETVGRGLEYALADWCVARVAERLGNTDDKQLFDQRAQAYRHYFDPATGFMRGKDSHGRFSFSQSTSQGDGVFFSPFHTAPINRDYTEGNAWQYTWLVPHDVNGLVSLFGSEQRFVSKLDSLFIVSSDLGGEAPPDISGLIGQYAHGNEPSHHILYMYNYVGMPWKAAPLLRRIMNELYHDAPDGLSGNEDVGQMSAWYVLSAMGLYQVEPAGGMYIIGTPLFSQMTLRLAQGRNFTISAKNNSSENIYVQQALLNGKPYTRSYIMYEDIIRGGRLELLMGSSPSSFGTLTADRPHSCHQ